MMVYFVGTLILISLLLGLWQLWVGLRFPLHWDRPESPNFPSVLILKPLKGVQENLRSCLESWVKQGPQGKIQIVFGVGSAHDPVLEKLPQWFPESSHPHCRIQVCSQTLGPNGKISTLMQIPLPAETEVIIISDADVWAPEGLIKSLVSQLETEGIDLVTCFYMLSNPSHPAMLWEGAAINADFWSQVLQSCSLKPVNFALGAVMAVRKNGLDRIGGFSALKDFLADDYQLGNQIQRTGGKIQLSEKVVECRENPMGWGAVWKHQLRWARTIRLEEPVGYFFSLLTNISLWSLLGLLLFPTTGMMVGLSIGALVFRIVQSGILQQKLTGKRGHWFSQWWVIALKDLFQAALWVASFTGNRVEWKGVRYRVKRGGKLEREHSA